jgi:hypothetical protein
MKSNAQNKNRGRSNIRGRGDRGGQVKPQDGMFQSQSVSKTMTKGDHKETLGTRPVYQPKNTTKK